MAGIQPSGTSIAVSATAAPDRGSNLGEGGGGGGGSGRDEVTNEEVVDSAMSVTPHEHINTAPSRAGHDASEVSGCQGEGDDVEHRSAIGDQVSLSTSETTPTFRESSANIPNDNATASSHGAAQLHTPPLTAQSSPDLGLTHTIATAVQPQPHAPPKRFTSVNINKRFLERTPSSSGTSLGGSHLAAHASGTANAGNSGQQRGASPSSRSPSVDRPTPSRLVTAKLTAVPQPSAASTSGWLRASSSTPGNSTTSTPPSSSPQPSANDSNTGQAASTSSQQTLKRRPGEPSASNGTPPSRSTSNSAQHGTKPAWGTVPHPPSKPGPVRGAPGKEIQNDFPTAAEAAHGRKIKASNTQLAAETAAAQMAAQKQAMIETAAAFRGAHLDANARHWDEMEDEDSDFLAGVIEFGDGTQYKIEHKAEATPSHDLPPSSEPTASEHPQGAPVHSHSIVTKDERFGEDIGRSWPRTRTSTVQSTVSNSLPSRPTVLQHAGSRHSPTDGPASGSTRSPHDGTSPTSRVLFNERSNRLEPWSNTKPRLGLVQAPAPMTRRDSREDHPPLNYQRSQAPPQLQNRDAPSHSHPSPANVHLLQKGSSGPDSAWKGGPPRGFSHVAERGRWGDSPGLRGAPSPREEERPWDTRRRESMSSSEMPGSSARESSRGREGQWDTGSASQGHETDHNRNRGRRDSLVGQPLPPLLPYSLARDRSRDTGRQLPPHLSRMPPPPVPPIRSAPGRDMLSHTIHPQSSMVSPSPSVHSLLSPSDQAPSTTSLSGLPAMSDEGVDKDTLVKDAMQLAIERAKKRKQEGEEEERQRLEAAERARKKAEALATAQEEKRRTEALPPPEKEKQHLEPLVQEASEATVKLNDLQTFDRSREGAKNENQAEVAPSKTNLERSAASHVRAIHQQPTLPRRPSIPPLPIHITPASQADSWRSKATPVPSLPRRPSQSLNAPSPSRGPLPPSKGPEIDLTLKPDENIEVVDFCDLGKLIGRASSPEPPITTSELVPAAPLIRSKRPVASDFFDDRPLSSREPVSSTKSDQPSWRRSLSKTGGVSALTASGNEGGTQTMPVFSPDEFAPVKDTTPMSDSKPPSSPTASPPFVRHSSQGDQTSSSSTTQSAYVSPAVLALRSPRMASHFKEAPMSTLTDTMSRIKGALDGMQSQESPLTTLSRETKENSLEQRVQPASALGKARVNEPVTGLWRERRESRSEIIPNVTKILAPLSPRPRPVPIEIFDVSCSGPPQSPKPAWGAFVVNFPKESRVRDPVSKKQLHFWSLPHPGVRWDILSWDPPVEGMNKRELSRDEIFHRKHTVKGGKPRVLLSNQRVARLQPAQLDPSQESSNVASQHALVTAAGVKIKLPSKALPTRQNATSSSNPVSFDRPRDSSVPSWRRSATPLTPLKRDRQTTGPLNGSPPDHQLNTTSRSPPPEPSTPLPQFSKPKSGIPSRPSSAHSATVSLPTTASSDSRSSVSKRPSGPDVAFFRTLRSDTEADNGKPLPRFTVSSELDVSESTDLFPVKHQAADGVISVEPAQPALIPQKGSTQRVPPGETSLPRLVASKPESKSSDDSTSATRPVTPPPTHPGSTWGKSPLSFPMKDSPGRSAPDPEHLKAVWSQASERPAGSTSNSLKGIADDLPSIPFTVQDMKSEDGETPPPTAPAPTPSRLSLQEVTRAFQQVPGAPAPSAASRPSPYAQTPLLSPGSTQAHRSTQPIAISLPPQHGVRPAFAPYPHSMVGHSPSPTLMYAPGVHSPVAHHRMMVNGPSPPIAHGMWLPTPPPPSQPASFIRPAGAPPTQMMYPTPAAGTSPGGPSQLMHRRMSVVSPGGVAPPSAPPMYPGHPMDIQSHIHAHSPHQAHAHPVGHPVQHMHMGHMFSPPQPGQAPTMYGVPVGAGRGGMMPRPGYEGYSAVPPHNAGYQSVPSTSFVFQS